MSLLRSFVKLSVIIVIAGGSFFGIQGYMATKSEATTRTVAIAIADPIAEKIVEDFALITAIKPMRPMSPIYPTIKYKPAQLAVVAVKKPTKAKVAVRSMHKKPLQLAYVADRGV